MLSKETPILRKFVLLAFWSLVVYLIFITEVGAIPGSVGAMIQGVWVPVIIVLAVAFLLFAPSSAEKITKPVRGFFGLVVLAFVLYWILW